MNPQSLLPMLEKLYASPFLVVAVTFSRNQYEVVLNRVQHANPQVRDGRGRPTGPLDPACLDRSAASLGCLGAVPSPGVRSPHDRSSHGVLRWCVAAHAARVVAVSGLIRMWLVCEQVTTPC